MQTNSVVRYLDYITIHLYVTRIFLTPLQLRAVTNGKNFFHFLKCVVSLFLLFALVFSLFQTPIFENRLPCSNSDFRKQTPIFHLPFFHINLRFSNSNSDFQQNKHRFFKSNSDVPLSFRTYTRLGVIRE